MRELELMGTLGCHLCDLAEAVIAKEREKLEGYQATLVKLEEQKATIAAL